MTTDDTEEDPFLLRLVARHARDEDDEYVLGLARVVLLASAVLDPDPPDLVETWTETRKGIANLLRDRLPESRLRIDSGGRRVKLHSSEWDSLSDAVLVASSPEWLAEIARSTFAPPCAPVLVDRAHPHGGSGAIEAELTPTRFDEGDIPVKACAVAPDGAILRGPLGRIRTCTMRLRTPPLDPSSHERVKRDDFQGTKLRRATRVGIQDSNLDSARTATPLSRDHLPTMCLLDSRFTESNEADLVLHRHVHLPFH